jgi:hypothetical protein
VVRGGFSGSPGEGGAPCGNSCEGEGLGGGLFLGRVFVCDGGLSLVVFGLRLCLCVGVGFYNFRFVGIGAFGSIVSGGGYLTSNDVFDDIVEICVFENIILYYRLDMCGSRDRACNFGLSISWPMEPDLPLEMRI